MQGTRSWPPAATSAETASAPGDGKRALGWALAAAGVTGLAASATFGVLALSGKSTVDAHCDGPRCDREGLEAASQGRILTGLGTGAFVLGAVGVGVGGYFVLFSGERRVGTLSPWLAPGAGGLAARGAF